MVSALDSGSSGPGSRPGWGHCVVFLGKTLYSQTQVYKWVPYCSAMLRHNSRKWMALLTDASSNSRRCLLTRELTVYKIVSEALEGKLCFCNLHKLYGVL